MSIVEQLQKAGKDAAVYISKGAHFRAIIVPEDVRVENGQTLRVKQVEADFAPHGVYATEDPAVIEHLEGLESFNVEFWRKGLEPDAMRPTLEEIAPEVARATQELDVLALEAIREQEQATHQRESVLIIVSAGIAQIEAAAGPEEEAPLGEPVQEPVT